MPIKGFSCFSYSDHFVQWNKTILATLIAGSFKEHFDEIILKLGHWPTSRCRYKVFLFLTLVAICAGS